MVTSIRFKSSEAVMSAITTKKTYILNCVTESY